MVNLSKSPAISGPGSYVPENRAYLRMPFLMIQQPFAVKDRYNRLKAQ